MGAVSGMLDTFDGLNYVGDLFISGVQAWARDFGAVQRIDTEKGIGSLDEGLWSTVQLMLHQARSPAKR